MRHLLANLTVYVIAALIFGGAAFFAWVRSTQVVLSREAAVVERFAPASAHGFEWRGLGRDGYIRNCANCHLRDGSGWDQYPGLHGVGGALTSGRERFIDLHLNGLDTPRWRAPMPPMGHIADPELAAILNFVVTEFGGVSPGAGAPPLFLPEEIARRR